MSVIIISSFFVGSTQAKGPDLVENLQEQSVEEDKTLYTEQELINLVYAAADEFGANRKELLRTVKCEAKKRLVDGTLYYDASAKSDYAEDSWGLSQWNIAAGNKNFEGKPITHAQAKDAPYAVRLMASYFVKGKAHLWSCY